MKIKSRHKLIPAIAMVLVSAVVLSSASYAWFTMSRTVTAEGITLTAVAPTNLLINHQATDGTEAKDKFGETTQIKEVYTGKIIPASSSDGLNFFAPREIKGTTGAPVEKTIFDKVTTALAENTVDAEGYYADFKLWLKTTGDKDIKVTLSDILTSITGTPDTGDGKTTINDAVRFAILGADGTTLIATGKEATNNTYALMGNKIATQTLFTEVLGPVVAITDGTGEGWKGLALTGNNDVTKSQFTVTKGDAATPITVRVWIEGQAAACKGTAAHANFNLTLGFKDVDYVETTTTVAP